MELDTSGFATQGPTVFAGNIGDNKYIIQVSPMGIRLLEGGKKKKEKTKNLSYFLSFTLGSPGSKHESKREMININIKA